MTNKLIFQVAIKDHLFQAGAATFAVCSILLIKASMIAPSLPAPSPAVAPIAAPAPAPQSQSFSLANDKLTPKVAGKWVIDIANGADADFPGLRMALVNAKPGDVIELRPGVYKESILLTSDITITGTLGADGKPTAMIEATNTSAVIVKAGTVKLSNLVITQPEIGSNPDTVPYAMDLDGGTLELNHVTVLSRSSSAMHIQAGVFSANDSTFTGYRGIDQNGGIVTCTNCITTGNQETGFLIAKTGPAILETKIVHLISEKNAHTGFVAAGANVTVEDSQFINNAEIGASAGANANVKFKNCTFTGNLAGGYVGTDNSVVEIVGSKINDNRQHGVSGMGDSKTVVNDSEILNNSEYGSVKKDKSEITISASTKVSGNKTGEHWP